MHIHQGPITFLIFNPTPWLLALGTETQGVVVELYPSQVGRPFAEINQFP